MDKHYKPERENKHMTKAERNLIKVLRAEEANARTISEYYKQENNQVKALCYLREARTLMHVRVMIECGSIKDYAEVYNVELE